MIANIAKYPVGTKFTDILQKSSTATTITDAQNRLFISLPPKSFTVYIQGEPPCFDYELSKKLSSGSITKFESPNSISAINLLQIASNTKYDAAKNILLKPGFKVEQGAIFEAFIDGCGGDK